MTSSRPPVRPIGMGKATRGVELAPVDDLDERPGGRSADDEGARARASISSPRTG